jgi:hypothetical protein
MSADYFVFSSPLVRKTKARAEAVNAFFSALATGLGFLPSKAQFYEGRVNFCGAATGAAGVYTVTAPFAVTLTDGLRLVWRPPITNTGATTLNIGTGNVAVTNFAGSALSGGECAAACDVETIYHAATNQHRIINPQVAVGVVTVNNLLIASSTDTTPDTAVNKILVTANGGLKQTKNNPAGNESLTHALDFTNLAVVTDADDADRLAVYDNSAAAMKYMTRARFTRRPTLTNSHMGMI